jgi:peptide/nickel transport system permease protein
MAAYLLRRFVFAVLLVFSVSSAALMLTRLAPGDYADQTLAQTGDTAVAEALRERYGLNRSIGGQYADWLGKAVRFDFGRSMVYDRPVHDLISERAANSAILALSALALATLVGIPLGIVSGSRRGVLPQAVRAASVLLLSMPPLLTSLVLVFLAARTGWLPVGGMSSPGLGAVEGVGGTASAGYAADLLRHMIVPVLALALPLAAMFERLQAEAIGDTIGQPFVLATMGRGVPPARIVWRDALKPALRPVVSVYGLVVGTLLSGSFAVEIITSWPGLGQLMLNALRQRDIYLVAGCAAIGSIFLAAGTFLSDAALALADPRTTE